MNRRTALKAGGLLAALGVGAGTGTASADPQGQIGTSSDPLQGLYTDELYGNGGTITVRDDIDFSNSNSIQDAGTDAITFDGTQNVSIPSGNLDMNGNDLVNVGSISGNNSLWEDAGDDGLLNPAQAGDNGIGVTNVQTDNLTDNGSGDVTMGNSLDLNSNDITNAGTVDGVSISTHASRHLPTGADSLATQSPVALGTSNAEGTADAFARADHVHAHGALGSETGGGNPHHSLATTSAPGFLSTGDKSKLNNLASDASSAYVNSSGDTVTGDLVLDGNSLDLTNGASIAAAGTDAITVDSNQNVTVSNGDLTVSPSADSTTTLDVQDTNGNSLLSADTSNHKLQVFNDDGTDSVNVSHDLASGKVSTSGLPLRLTPGGNLELNPGTDIIELYGILRGEFSTDLIIRQYTANTVTNDTKTLRLDTIESDSGDTANIELNAGSTNGSVQVTNGNLDVQTGTIENTTGSLTLSHEDVGNGTSLTLDAGSNDQSLVVNNLPSQEDTVLTIDSSGNVGTSTKSSSEIQSYTGAAVYLGTDQSLGSADTDIVVEFDSVQFDTGSNFDTATNSFTAPQDGYYSVDANVTVNRDTTDNYAVKLERNGTDITGARVECTDTERNASLGTTVSLNSGDTIRVVVQLFTSVSSDVIQAESSLSIDLEGQA